jgi:hypothetical protein
MEAAYTTQIEVLSKETKIHEMYIDKTVHIATFKKLQLRKRLVDMDGNKIYKDGGKMKLGKTKLTTTLSQAGLVSTRNSILCCMDRKSYARGFEHFMVNFVIL